MYRHINEAKLTKKLKNILDRYWSWPPSWRFWTLRSFVIGHNKPWRVLTRLYTVFCTAYFRKNTAKWHELVLLQHFYTYFVFLYQNLCTTIFLYQIRNLIPFFQKELWTMWHILAPTCSINRIALLNCTQYKSSHL